MFGTLLDKCDVFVFNPFPKTLAAVRSPEQEHRLPKVRDEALQWDAVVRGTKRANGGTETVGSQQ